MTHASYLVITGPHDSLGRAPFDLYWSEPDGVFRNEPSDDGKPVGYRRGQCFRAVPEDYIKRGAILVSSEAIAKRLAWALLVLLASCMHVTTSGDSSPELGELFVCRGQILCPDVEPIQLDERICGPRGEADQILAALEADHPGCTIDGFCGGVGNVENGGAGLPRLCLLEMP